MNIGNILLNFLWVIEEKWGIQKFLDSNENKTSN
jgi:hypothetical protein